MVKIGTINAHEIRSYMERQPVTDIKTEGERNDRKKRSPYLGTSLSKLIPPRENQGGMEKALHGAERNLGSG